jgi:hypothetical protein
MPLVVTLVAASTPTFVKGLGLQLVSSVDHLQLRQPSAANCSIALEQIY